MSKVGLAIVVVALIILAANAVFRASATASTPAAVRVLGRTDSDALTVWRVQMQEGGNCYVFSVANNQPFVHCL